MKQIALTPAQLHLLKMMSFAKDDKTLDDIKNVLASFFAQKAEEEMDKLWDTGEWNQEKNENLLHEHLRTPYRQ